VGVGARVAVGPGDVVAVTDGEAVGPLDSSSPPHAAPSPATRTGRRTTAMSVRVVVELELIIYQFSLSAN
jgi:hypothetical protein